MNYLLHKPVVILYVIGKTFNINIGDISKLQYEYIFLSKLVIKNSLAKASYRFLICLLGNDYYLNMFMEENAPFPENMMNQTKASDCQRE